MKEKPISKLKVALIGLLAGAVGLPLTSSQTDTSAQRTAARTTQQFRAASPTEKSAPAPQAPSNSFGFTIRGLDGMAPHTLFGHGGRTPKEWGMSRECARMVRNHRMRSLGISGQRI